MPVWFRFDRPYDFRVKAGVDIAYPAGFASLIPDAHAMAAEAAGAGRRIARPENAHAKLGRRNARSAALRKQGRNLA